MTEREQIIAFEADLSKLVTRYCHEFQLSLASAIGVLQVEQHRLIKAVLDDDSDDTDRWGGDYGDEE